MTFIFFDLVSDVFAKEQFTQDKWSHGPHIQSLCLSQNVLVCRVYCAIFFLFLEVKHVRIISHYQPVYFNIFLLPASKPTHHDQRIKTYLGRQTNDTTKKKQKKNPPHCKFSNTTQAAFSPLCFICSVPNDKHPHPLTLTKL